MTTTTAERGQIGITPTRFSPARRSAERGKDQPCIDYGRLSAAVKRCLKNKGLSQGDAAEEIKIGSSTVSRLITDHAPMDFDNVARICDWLDLPIAAFLNTDEICEELRTITRDRRNTLEIIVCIVHQDPAIRKDAKHEFAEIFAAAYSQFQSMSVISDNRE